MSLSYKGFAHVSLIAVVPWGTKITKRSALFIGYIAWFITREIKVFLIMKREL